MHLAAGAGTPAARPARRGGAVGGQARDPLLLDDIAEGSLMSLHPEAAGYCMQLTVLNLMTRVLETASHLQREVQADPSGEDPHRRGRVMKLAQRLANEQSAVDRALGSAVSADPALEPTLGAARRGAARSPGRGRPDGAGARRPPGGACRPESRAHAAGGGCGREGTGCPHGRGAGQPVE